LSTVSALHQTAALHEFVEHYLAAGSPDIANRILDFVSKADTRLLSAFGGVALLITTVMTLGAVEQAFNNIFRAPQARSYARRFTEYLSVVFAAPPIIVVILAFRAGITNFLPHWLALQWALSSLIVWGVICLVYIFFPYTKVQLGSALVGSLAATLLLGLAQRMFVYFQYGASSYEAIYGALAAIPIFMTWIYMSWTILLYGAELAAAMQQANGQHSDADFAGQDFWRAAALLTMLRLAERMRNQRTCVGVDSIAGELGVDKQVLLPLLGRLKEAGLIVEVRDARSDTPHQGLFLARDPSLISLAEVIRHASSRCAQRVREPRVQSAIRMATQCESEALKTLTVRHLLGETNEPNLPLEQSASRGSDAVRDGSV
jgi:membrane protein